MLKQLFHWNQKYAPFCLCFYFLLGCIGLFFSIQLYKNLRTDMEELLPENARSVIDYNEVTNRIPSYQNLAVLIFSDDIKASQRFVEDLASKLQENPSSVLEYVEYKLTKEIHFFNQRKALMIDLTDLKKIKDYIFQKIEYEKLLYNPLTIFSEQNIDPPSLDIETLKKKYEDKAHWATQLPGGYYASKDEKIRLLLAHLKGRGLKNSLKLQHLIQETIQELKPQAYAKDLQIRLTGTVEDMIEESLALVEDLEYSTVLVIVFVFFVMVLFFQSFWATILLNVSLFIGVFWTFGIAYYLIGYLNANTGFLASIVIGNGINFGVIYLARYLEERRNKKEHSLALWIATQKTYPATTTAAAAAGLSYGSLMLTEFRGFSQFGVIGCCGMFFCLLSTYTVLPALLSLFDAWFGSKWIRLTKPRWSFGSFLGKIIQKFSHTLLALSLCSMIACICLLPQLKNSIILTDLTKLRDKRCMQSGSGAYFHYINELLNFPASPSFILPMDTESSMKIANLLQKEKTKKSSPITMVSSIFDFIPPQQHEKILLLKEIQMLLSPQILKHMDEKDKKTVKDYLITENLMPYHKKDLPELILRKFQEKDKSIGKMLIVDRDYNPQEDKFDTLKAFVENVRTTVDSVAPGTPIVGSTFINYDLFEAIHRDGPKATAFAFLSVMFLVIFLFRSPSLIIQVLGSLFLGLFWLLGMMLGFSIKINFLNFIALPITFGIGVDYAVNILQRYREQSDGDIIQAIGNTAGAVVLVSLTTSLGYSSLLIAGNQAFVSFGALAVLGEIACVISAVITLPAAIQVVQKLKSR